MARCGRSLVLCVLLSLLDDDVVLRAPVVGELDDDVMFQDDRVEQLAEGVFEVEPRLVLLALRRCGLPP